MGEKKRGRRRERGIQGGRGGREEGDEEGRGRREEGERRME